MTYLAKSEIWMELDGFTQTVSRSDLHAYLADGWIFCDAQVYVRDDNLGVNVYVQASTARNLILHHDFEYGKKTAFSQVNLTMLRKSGALKDKV